MALRWPGKWVSLTGLFVYPLCNKQQSITVALKDGKRENSTLQKQDEIALVLEDTVQQGFGSVV